MYQGVKQKEIKKQGGNCGVVKLRDLEGKKRLNEILRPGPLVEFPTKPFVPGKDIA